MARRRKLHAIGVLALLPALLLGASPRLAAAESVIFRWANDGDAGAMDPYVRNESFQLSFLQNIYETLVRRAADLSLQPALAERWEAVGPTTWRFHLRPGVRWQDGSSFTAADVVFSAARVRRPNAVMRVALDAVREVRALDDLTVEVETNGPDPIFPQEITSWMILSKSWAERNGAQEVAVLGKGEENFATRHAMGTGPFRLAAREPDRRTVLERNPGWWDRPQHNLDRVEFNVVGNAATRVAALLSGEMDMIYSVPPQDMDRIGHTPGLRLLVTPELRTIFLGMDQARPELLKSDVKGRNPFKDRRVREAFALAIDEGAIAGRVMRGQARPTWLMWGPGVVGFDPALNRRPDPDPARAKQLLAEAGYPDGFGVTLDCPNDRYVNDEAICTAVAAMLARVGVRVSVDARSKSRYFAETGYPNYQTSFYLLGWTPSSYDALNAIQSLLITRAGGRGLTNGGGYSSPEVDRLAAAIAVEQGPAKRIEEIHEVARIVQRDIAYIPLHQQSVVWAARDGVELVQMADNYFPLRLVRAGPRAGTSAGASAAGSAAAEKPVTAR